jgi:hypothetical protein
MAESTPTTLTHYALPTDATAAARQRAEIVARGALRPRTAQDAARTALAHHQHTYVVPRDAIAGLIAVRCCDCGEVAELTIHKTTWTGAPYSRADAALVHA